MLCRGLGDVGRLGSGLARAPIAHVYRLQVLSLRLLPHPSLLHDSLHSPTGCGPEGKITRCRNEGLPGKILDDSIRHLSLITANMLCVKLNAVRVSGLHSDALRL